MRDYYLHPRYDRDHGMRGGVGHHYETSAAAHEYELEIGNNANASAEMIAICCVQDEILEYLATSPSILSNVLLTMYHQKVDEINQQYEENEKKREDAEKLKSYKAKYHE